MESEVALLRAAAVCGAMILATPVFAAGARAGVGARANGPTPSEQVDANAQNNANAAVARNNATPAYSSTSSATTTSQATDAPNAGAGASSILSGIATSSPRSLTGNAAGSTNRSIASRPPAAQ